MPPNELRIFISSTFRDLQEEREYLVRKVFPDIRALCRERGIHFTEIDLRWGLTDEHVALGQVVRICLDEVDRCRPFFIGITGSRYGFVPTLDDIRNDPETLERYRWVEKAMQLGRSITEMETLYALVDDELVGSDIDRQPADRARFYFRQTETDDRRESDEERTALAAYRQRIRAGGCPVETFSTPEELGRAISSALREIIATDFADAHPRSPLEIERSRHVAFSLDRRRAYIPNGSALARLDDHALSEDPPLVLFAESGSGKSSLLAYWADRLRRTRPEFFIVEHYVGTGAAATEHHEIIRHLCAEIKEEFGRTEEIPTTPARLETAFGQWLGYAEHGLRQQERRMVVILDGLDQLPEAAQKLLWIPEIIPRSVRVVASTTSSQIHDRLQSRSWRSFAVDALSKDDRHALVARYLASFGKNLTDVQSDRIASDEKCGHPLFLKTLLEELRVVGRHEELEMHLDRLLSAGDTDDLFRVVLERIELDHGAEPVREVLSLIWASRHGLEERELAELGGLSRLKVATMVAGLEYHLMLDDGRLDFFHDYLRRAVESRYLNEESRKRQMHRRIAAYFEAQPPSRRSAEERLFGYDEAEDDSNLAATLADLDLLALLAEESGMSLPMIYWAQLRRKGYDPVETYRSSLEQPQESAALFSPLHHARTVADILRHLGLWSDAIELLHALPEIGTEAIEVEGTNEPSSSRAERAGVENVLGMLLLLRSEYDEAEARLKQARHLFLSIGDKPSASRALNNLGVLYRRHGDTDRSAACFEECLALSESIDDREGIGRSLINRGTVHLMRHEYDRARSCFERALVIAEGLGDRMLERSTVLSLGDLEASCHEFESASARFRKSIEIGRQLGDRRGVGHALRSLGTVMFRRGDYTEAEDCFSDSLAIAEEIGDLPMKRENLSMLGLTHNRRGDYDRALDCLEQLQATDDPKPSSRATTLGNLGRVHESRRDHEQALAHFEQAAEEFRTLDDAHGEMYWLQGSARVLLEIVRGVDDSKSASMPDYLPRYVPDLRSSSNKSWRTIALLQARHLVEESLRLASSFDYPAFVFDGELLLAIIEAVGGNSEGAGNRLRHLFDRTDTVEQKGQIHYWLWRFKLDVEVDHRSEAERIYAKEVERTDDVVCRGRLAELRGERE